MTDEDSDAYHAALFREVMRLRLEERVLLGIADNARLEADDYVHLASRFGLNTLPTADAPPFVASLFRAELARAMLHTRRAGRIAKLIGADSSLLTEVLARLRVLSATLLKTADSQGGGSNG